uniref:Adhesion G-protein coupled receptor G7-like n=1 Tax=Kryptolebias marmoratus TaxID=37003 RepID=A0A3Q2ZV01_KRYMA
MDARLWLVCTFAVPLVSSTSGTNTNPPTGPPAVLPTSSSAVGFFNISAADQTTTPLDETAEPSGRTTGTSDRTGVLTQPNGQLSDQTPAPGTTLSPTEHLTLPPEGHSEPTESPTPVGSTGSGVTADLLTTSAYPRSTSVPATSPRETSWTEAHSTTTADVFPTTSPAHGTTGPLTVRTTAVNSGTSPTSLTSPDPPDPTHFTTAIPPNPTSFTTTISPDPTQFTTTIPPDPTQFTTTIPPETSHFTTDFPSDPTSFTTTTPPDPTPDPPTNSTTHPPDPPTNSTTHPPDPPTNSTTQPPDPPTNSTTHPPHPTPSTTSPPTQTTSTTPLPLKCLNGGKEDNGVCVCPDEWTGETCSVGNFCNATTLNGHKFQDTPIGWFAYSEGTCPEGTGGAGKPEASTRCLQNSDGSLSFETPRVFQCDQTLASIQQNLTSGADLEVLASSTQILTSNPENLQAENVTAAARIANTLLLSPNATESVRVAAVATVSQLLNASVERNTEQINATQELTLTLDQLSVNLSSNSNISQVVQPNLVVQSAQVLAKDSQGVQFTSLSGSSGSFVANRIQLNTNVSKVTVENGFKADALVYIQFPLGSSVSGRQKASNVSLGFVLYQNDRFFPSTRYKKSRASIRVLSANVGGLDRSVVPQHVEMRFRVKIPNKTYLHDFSCVFWNYTLEDWSTRGCSKENSSNEELRCSCNHTTNFAALWSYRESYTYADALEAISIVGLSFSMLGLIVTIIHHIHVNFWQKSQERQTKLNSKMSLLCIYTSLLAFIITFLSGVQNSVHQSNKKMDPSPQNDILESDLHVEPDQGSCTAVVALLHFFLLATFAWNSVYGTQLVLLVRSMRRSLPPHWTPLSLGIGWGKGSDQYSDQKLSSNCPEPRNGTGGLQLKHHYRPEPLNFDLLF